MNIRSARPKDLAEIAELQGAWDMAWFGRREQDPDDVWDSLRRAEPMATRTRADVRATALIAAAWWWSTEIRLVVDPQIEPSPVYDHLLPWLADQPEPHIEALGTDLALQAALARRGWIHRRSSFDLLRPVTPDWVLPTPSWPAGIIVQDLRPQDAEAVHQLIYVGAGWAEVAGHPERGFPEWQSIFITSETLPSQQVLAWRADALVGVATGRSFTDGTGWIAQLAVTRNERRQGLGRALLLEGLRRRRAAGATSLGLGVQAQNRGAISLYLSVGLVVDREWLVYFPPER